MMNSFEDLISSSNANEYIPLYNVDTNINDLSISTHLHHHKLYQTLHINSTTLSTETNSTFIPDPPFYDPAMLSHHHHHQNHFMPISESTHVPPSSNGLIRPLSQSEPFNINNASPPHINHNCGGKKRKRNINDEKEVEKPRDVVHVRARRGQATDSHSLSERLRREKINENLRSLQDLVPGCYKQTMGMAVMLDVIINYVRSLQNQIEFLSMKLSAASASMYYDFNSSEMDMQGRSGYEAQLLERMVGEGYGTGGFPLFHI